MLWPVACGCGIRREIHRGKAPRSGRTRTCLVAARIAFCGPGPKRSPVVYKSAICHFDILTLLFILASSPMLSVSSPRMFSKLNPLNALRRSNKEEPPKRPRTGLFMKLWRRSLSSSQSPQTKVVTRSQLTRHNISAAQALAPSPERRGLGGRRKLLVRTSDLLSSDFILPLEMNLSSRS